MAGVKDIFGQALNSLSSLTTAQKVIAGAIVILVFGGLISLTFFGKKADYKVLYSNLTQEDASAVLTKLKETNISYTLSENGTAILVPSGQVHETRLSLAGAGLPRGGGVGFEIFDTTSLGTTDFVQRLNYQRALQGELARTISQFRQVRSARVHIATPKESVFIEDSKPPSASVSIAMAGREKLSKGEIQSIVNLVGSAVPGLISENITVVDTDGRLLFRKEGDEDSLLSATQLEYQLKVERNLRNKVETMLEQVVGIDKALARVSVDMDFNQIDMTEESFDPEGQVVRSEQLLTEGEGDGSSAQGIPGVKGQLATFSDSGSEGAGGKKSFRRDNVTRNYEISRTTRHIQESTGKIKRLSVAVMVDGNYDKVEGEKDEVTMQYKSRSEEEIARFMKMTQNAVGYDPERGDQVEVVSMPFHLSQLPEPKIDYLVNVRKLIDQLAVPIVLLIVGICALLFIVRPFLRMMASQQVEAQKRAERAAKGVPELEEEEEEEELRLSPKNMSDQERIYRLAQSDPDRAADLVRRWLREEG